MVEHKVSPSQISAMRQCPRRWYYQSIMGFRAPDTPSTLYGSAMHALIEKRVQTGKWPQGPEFEGPGPMVSARKAFATMVKAIQPTRQDLKQAVVEADWEIAASEELPLASRGRIDLQIKGRLLDWKSTAGLKYVKSLQDRLKDPQVVLYTKAALLAGSVTLPSQFWHIYATSRSPVQGLAVQTVVTADVLAQGLAGVGETMAQMRDIIVGCASDSEVPRNTRACDDFGGCPHMDRCFAKKEITMGTFEDKLAKRRAALGLNPPAAVPEPQETKIKDPAPEKAPKAKATFGAAKSTSVLTAPPTAQDVVDAASAEQSQVFEKSSLGWAKGGFSVTSTKPAQADESRTWAGMLLLINCLPLRGERPELFSDWIAPIVKTSQESFGVDHWAQIDFGKCKADVASRVACAAESGAVPPVMFIDRRDPLADFCVETLMRHYRVVIQKAG